MWGKIHFKASSFSSNSFSHYESCAGWRCWLCKTASSESWRIFSRKRNGRIWRRICTLWPFLSSCSSLSYMRCEIKWERNTQNNNTKKITKRKPPRGGVETNQSTLPLGGKPCRIGVVAWWRWRVFISIVRSVVLCWRDMLLYRPFLLTRFVLTQVLPERLPLKFRFILGVWRDWWWRVLPLGHGAHPGGLGERNLLIWVLEVCATFVSRRRS